MLELKSTITEIKSSVDRFNSRMEGKRTESEPEDRTTEINQSDQWRVNSLGGEKNEEGLRALCRL